MIYLRLAGKLEDVLTQLAYAEKLSERYNQEIVLYVNGSYDNNKEYYENVLIPSGILSNYTFVENYPLSEPVLFEGTSEFTQQVELRGYHGQDLIIDGDFFWRKDVVEYEYVKAKFSPSQDLLDYMSSFGITDNTLYIDAEPLDNTKKDEFALAGRLLSTQFEHFNNKVFDKVIVRSSYPDFFQTAGFETILNNNNILYVDIMQIPEVYRDATQVMFPYLCKSSFISNYLGSWWGHVLNTNPEHEIGILFPYGRIKRVKNAVDGISNEVLNQAVYNVGAFSMEEHQKEYNGQPSAFDGIVFEDPADEVRSNKLY